MNARTFRLGLGLLLSSCQLAVVDETLEYRCEADGGCAEGWVCVASRCVPDVPVGVSDGGPGSDAGPSADGGLDAGFPPDAGESDAGVDGGCPVRCGTGCGVLADGCDCGGCPGLTVCGGSGAPNVCALDTRFCSPSGFCWENPRPQGNNINALWGGDAGMLWGVGSTGTIVGWDGTRWFKAPCPTTADLMAVSGASASDVWAVGKEGTVLHFDGGTWGQVVTGTVFTSDLTGVYATPTAVWVVGAPRSAVSGPVLKMWNGVAWVDQTPSDPAFRNKSLLGIAGSSASNVHAVGDYLNYTLHWDGTSWSPIPTPQWSLYAVDVAATGEAYAVGFYGVLMRYSPGATTWQSLTPSGGVVPSVHVTGAGEILVTSNFSTIARYQDGGWEVESPGRGVYADYFTSIGEDPQGTIWAAGERGRLSRRGADAGWTLVSSGDWSHDLNSVFSAALDEGAAAGRSYHSIRNSDGSWTGDTSIGGIYLNYSLLGIAGTSPIDYHLVGAAGFIGQFVKGAFSVRTGGTGILRGAWAFPDGGALAVGDDGIFDQQPDRTFLKVHSLSAPPDGGQPSLGLTAIWADPVSGVPYAVGGGGAVVRGGTSGWSELPSAGSSDLFGIHGWSETDVWAVGAGGVVRRGDPNANSGWTTVASGTNAALRGISGAPGSDLYIVGGQGTILRWTGSTLEPLESGTRHRLNGVSVNRAGQVTVVGERGTVLRKSK